MQQLSSFILSIVAASGTVPTSFEPPSAATRLKAIGVVKDLPEILRRALDPTDDFEPMDRPGPHDWLAAHREVGQTFDDFVRSKPNRPDKRRHIIYLQPLGSFTKGRSPSLETLSSYAAAYFGMEVKVLPSLDLKDTKLTTRTNPTTRNRQILTGDVLRLLKDKLPQDAFCLLAITMDDLYPDPSWNFVFGQASLRDRVGVYSFARYDPTFYGEEPGKDDAQLLLRRSCKVLVHETAHMFGLQHCIYFKCVVNGSNHLAESDARPMYLCPACLHKLQHSIGFDVIHRYDELLRFDRKVGFEDEAEWLDHRLQWIRSGDQAGTTTEASPG